MIGIDWGTTSLRAYRLKNGHISDRRDVSRGITSVSANGFEAALRETVGDWLASETDVLMAGMVGSRQGWFEAPYLECPAGPAALAASLLPVAFDGVRIAIVPGLRGRDAVGVPDVIRGEETQLVGLLATMGRDGIACLPGSHSKWAEISDAGIAGFTTYMTGEAYAALRGHTILGRMIQDGPTDEAAFLDGVARARQGGGLLHHLFGVRALGLFGALADQAAGSYLSGLLIGHEISAVAPTGLVHLVGASALCRLYALALDQFGVQTTVAPEDLAAAGLAAIAEHAGWN